MKSKHLQYKIIFYFIIFIVKDLYAQTDDSLQSVVDDLIDENPSTEDVLSFSTTSETSTTSAIIVTNSATVISDPINLTNNPKAIPGAVIEYEIILTNTDVTNPDSISVNLPISDNLKLFVGDISSVGSGPILFTDGSVSSGLSYTFTNLLSTSDSLSFSINNGFSYSYTPISDPDGYDENITHIKIDLSGNFNATGNPNPYFSLRFKVCLL